MRSNFKCSGIITTISVYREKSSIYEYLVAGSVTGSLYKINLGLRGMAVGGLLGGGLGGVAGLLSLAVMKASGTSMEEVRYWQYKWRENRDANIRGASRMVSEKGDDNLLEDHDANLRQVKLSLDDIVDATTTATIENNK